MFSACCVEAGCIHKTPLALCTCKIPRPNRSRKKNPLQKFHTVQNLLPRQTHNNLYTYAEEKDPLLFSGYYLYAILYNEAVKAEF